MSNIICDEYNDPKADLMLLSNEGMTFKVHSCFLAAHSPVLRDMLEPSTSTVFDRSTPIDIDAPSDAIHDFLDLMTKPNITKLRTPLPLTALLALCEQYETPIVLERLFYPLQSVAREHPWATFVVADRTKNVALAHEALRHMYEGTNPWGVAELTTAHIDVERSRELSTGYLIGLVTILARAPYRASRSLPTYDWWKMADDFEPAK